MVDRIVRLGQRTMAARVGGQYLVIPIQLLGRHDLHGQRLAVIGDDAARFRVQRVLGIDEVSMILQEPIHPVRRAALFVGRERQDDVAIRNEPLLLQSNEIGDHDGIAGLHVLRAATVVVAVLLDELKRIGGPVLGSRFDHVEVADDENRPQPPTRLAAIAGDQVALPLVGPHHGDIGRGESGIEQSLRHRLRRHGGASDRIRGVDLDQLFEDVVRPLARDFLALRGGPCRLQAHGTGQDGDRVQRRAVFQL